jgi:outer membrane protein TolC
VLFVLGTMSATAHADRELTIGETLKLARENNRDLKAAREGLALVQVAVEQTRAVLLPTLAAQGKYTFNYPSAVLDASIFTQATEALAAVLRDTAGNPVQAGALQGYIDQLHAANVTPITIVKGNQLDFSATATLPVLAPSAYPAYQAAVATRKATAANIAVTELQVLFGAATGFYAAAGADELVAARQHAIEVAGETVKNAKARLEAGVVNRVELTRAELAYNQTKQRFIEAQDTRALAYRALATLILLREPFVVRPDDPKREPVQVGVADMQRDALKLRPEFTAYELNVVAAKKQELSGWLRWLPTIGAFARFGAGNYSGFSGKNYSFATGVQADWVLYDGGLRDAARHQAAAQKRQLALQLEQLHDTINDDIAQASREVGTKREALTTAETAVRLSKETLDLVRAQHDAGTVTQLDLLAAQDALFLSEAGVAQARFDLALWRLRLERTAGTFGTARSDVR